MKQTKYLLTILALVLLQSCTDNKIEQLEQEISNLKKSQYQPGLGEIMGYIQVRHAKLWFAGQAENWNLAQYELEELEEGFTDIKSMHRIHEKLPKPSAVMIDETMSTPIKGLRQSIAVKNISQFNLSYQLLTNACMACHTASGVTYIKLAIPTNPPYSNQTYK